MLWQKFDPNAWARQKIMVNFEISGFDYVGLILKIDHYFQGSDTDNFRFWPEMCGRSKNLRTLSFFTHSVLPKKLFEPNFYHKIWPLSLFFGLLPVTRHDFNKRFLSTYNLERSETLDESKSIYHLERTERFDGYCSTYNLERSERLKDLCQLINSSDARS